MAGFCGYGGELSGFVKCGENFVMGEGLAASQECCVEPFNSSVSKSSSA